MAVKRRSMIRMKSASMNFAFKICFFFNTLHHDRHDVVDPVAVVVTMRNHQNENHENLVENEIEEDDKLPSRPKILQNIVKKTQKSHRI